MISYENTLCVGELPVILPHGYMYTGGNFYPKSSSLSNLLC